MKKEPISNNLLSFVFDCECEFVKIGELKNTIYVLKKTDIDNKIFSKSLNIFEFINLAENKIFNKNYLISPIMDGFVIFDVATGNPLTHIGNGELHRLGTLEQEIEALEWIIRHLNTNCEKMVERLYCEHYNNYVV